MRIAIVNNLFKPFQRGGAELVAEFQADNFKKAGHDVIVITSLPGKVVAFDDKYPVYRLGGFPATFSRLQSMPSYLRVFWHLINIFNFATAFRVYRIIKKEKIDVVIGNNLFGLGLLIPMFVKFSKARYLAILHDIQLLHPSGLMFFGKESIIDSVGARVYQLITRLLFSFADGVTAPSDWLMNLYLKQGFFAGIKNAIIKNPDIDIDILPKLATNDFTMLYAAQLETHKGIRLLLDSVASLPGNWRLIVMGDGSQRAIVEKALQHNDKISYLPWQSRMLAELMAKSDLLVSPSLCYENAPLAIMRAQRAGLPVLASSLGGAIEIVDDPNYLFEPTVSVLHEKLEKIISNGLTGTKKEISQGNDDYCSELLALIG